MAMGVNAKAVRKKVRCPKCTAHFPEPAKAVFKCPICACQLSANGTTVLMENSSHQTEEVDTGHMKAVLGNDGQMKTQGPIDILKTEGSSSCRNGMKQEQNYIAQEQEENNQQSTTESAGVFKNDDTDGQPSIGNSTIESSFGEYGMPGPYSPTPSVTKSVNPVNGKQRGESPPQLFAGAKEESDLVRMEGQHFSGDSWKENSLMVREENNLITAVDEEIERQDCMVHGVSSNHHLQSEIFRATRCEFSFKYTLKDASPLQSDGDLIDRKQSPIAKTVSSEATLPNAEASDMPLQTPLRVRISKSLDESSDQSENERGVFGSETDSDGTSGSDFDFPAPWAEGLQDIVQPAPFSQNEGFHPNSETIVSAAPHQLELQDAYDTIDHEELSLQQESEKHYKASDAELSSQAKNAGKTIESESEFRDEGSNCKLLQPVLPSEKNHVSLRSPDREEITISDVKSLSSNAQSLDVNNSASQVSTIKNLVVLGNSEKRNGFGLEECFEGGEEQDIGMRVKFQLEKSGNMQQNTEGQQEASELLGVVVPSDRGQVLDMNDHRNVKQESISAEKEDLVASPSIGNANLTDSPTLPNLEYIPSNLDNMDCSDATHNISNSDGFQMVDLREYNKKGRFHTPQMIEDLSSSMSKIMQSNNVTKARDARTGNRNTPPLMETTELEQDLYKPPHVSYGNDSHSALWAQGETAVPDGTFISTSKAKLYQENKCTQKSSHGIISRNLGSRMITSHNGGDNFVSGEERNFRGQAVSQEGSLQATSEHLGWEGSVTAAEDGSGHLDSHLMEGKPGSYSQYPVNNSNGFPVPNTQPYALTNHHYGFGATGTSQMYPYPLPSQTLLHPAAFQNRALSHCGYHAVSPACMFCSYHQHPHMQPQHAHPCGACFSLSGSKAYNCGLLEQWNCHQGSLGPPASRAGSLVDYPQARSSTNRIQRYDFPNAESGSWASSPRKYPPFPRNGATPYFTCRGCSRVLQVPSNLPPIDGMIQKLRCSACGKVTKFSADYYDQQRVLVSSIHSPELDSMVGAANTLLQYGTHSRPRPVSPVLGNIKSPYKHDMIKMNPVMHGLNEPSPQVNNATASKSLEQISQGGEFFKDQPRGRATNASRNIYGQHNPSISVNTTGPSHLQTASSMVGFMSPRIAASRPMDSVGFDRSKVNPVATVDEKEEGLDYGAPRISDGDSLDHSESRMRSPEYNQSCHETTHVDISQGVPSRGHQPLEQDSDFNEGRDTAPQEKKPGSPLLVLLNQESTRFRLNLEPRVRFEGSDSVMWSPASDSPVYAKSVRDRLQNREQDNHQSHGSPRQHFVTKGPRYIAGLLRRSLRDFGKGGQ